jgi:hypothetical protein
LNQSPAAPGVAAKPRQPWALGCNRFAVRLAPEDPYRYQSNRYVDTFPDLAFASPAPKPIHRVVDEQVVPFTPNDLLTDQRFNQLFSITACF